MSNINATLFIRRLQRALTHKSQRIVALEKELSTARSIIIKTANNIIDVDNCEQDSDEMNSCWECLKEHAILTTGRCDT
jgi:hypothetical protein